MTWVVNFEGKTDATTSNDIAATDYSCKAGFWRLLKIFEDNGVKGTWYMNGIIATRYPETLRELARLGHEIDGHNWANNIPMTTISASEEREVVRRTFDDIEKSIRHASPWLDGIGRGRVLHYDGFSGGERRDLERGLFDGRCSLHGECERQESRNCAIPAGIQMTLSSAAGTTIRASG